MNKAKTHILRKSDGYYHDVDWTEVHHGWDNNSETFVAKKNNSLTGRKSVLKTDSPTGRIAPPPLNVINDPQLLKGSKLEELKSFIDTCSAGSNAYAELTNYGVDDMETLLTLEEKDWSSVGIPQLQKNRIRAALKSYIPKPPPSTVKYPDILSFLESVKLASFYDQMVEFGVYTVPDFKDVSDEDFKTMGMKQLEINRLKKGL